MKKPRGLLLVVYIALLMIACGNPGEQSAPADDLVDPDDLALVALNIKQGMSRERVIEILGPATWASLPGDTGDFGVKDKDTSLTLFWRNPGLSVVEVHFDHEQKVRWDGGKPVQSTGGYTHFFEPSDKFDCKHPDREKLCR